MSMAFRFSPRIHTAMPWMQSAAAWASVKVCLCAVFARHWDDHVELQQDHVELQQDHVELRQDHVEMQQDHVELPRLAYFCQCSNSMCAIDIT